MRARFAMFGVLLFLLTVMVAAQTGAISGVARDQSGAVLPGVTVTIASPVLVEKTRSTVSDSNGRYQFNALPIGSYTVEFSLPGFNVLKHENVSVTTNGTAVVNADLKVGSIKEVVTVTAEAPLVDTQSARQRQVFKGEELNGFSGGAAGGRAGGGGGRASAPLYAPGVPAVVAVPAPGTDRYYYPPSTPPSQDAYAEIVENTFRRVSDDPLSTFSIDVDTASYANVRRFLNSGTLPPRDAIRIEEMINYFHFDYPQPKSNAPFSVTTELVESPWNPAHRLALIGLQGRDTFDDDKTPRNLVFLLDVSGSMQPADRLPLVKNGMRMLVDTLQPRDRVAIVTYAGYSGVALPSTTGDKKEVIHSAIESLSAGGSTNGASGIKLAYELARQQFVKGGVNRVILATDGDFNVGVTSQQELLTLIENERKSGVFLTVLGVGTGNLKDARMEMLADKGNGNYAYLDSIQEAQRVLVHEAASTLVTIAKDVKIQIEFNPQTVAAYRLIGYENRLLKAEDFNDDRKDAGEIGSGHSVTALYEIVPVGADIPSPSVDRLKYQPPPARPAAPATAAATPFADELMTVKLRYKDPDGDTSRLISSVIRSKPQAMTANVGFASAVAELGLLLRGSQYAGSASYEALTARARKFRGTDADGYRAEFIKLSEVARGLRTLQTATR